MKVRLLRAFARDEDGASAIEYALVAGFIAVVIVASLMLVGSSAQDLYGRIRDAVVCTVSRTCS